MSDLPNFPLAAFLGAAKAYPDKVAIAALTLSGAERWSYAKLSGLLFAAVDAFKAQGIQAGQSVPLAPEQSLATPLYVMALQVIGAKPYFSAQEPLSLTIADLVPQEAPDQAGVPNTALAPSDRCALLGPIASPAALAQIFAALTSGATLLCASAKLTTAQMPILLRRHDVSVLAGSSQDLALLLSLGLKPLPKLRQSQTLDAAPSDLAQSWQQIMGHGLISA